jgi:thiamine kinase-like enzyme
MRQPASLLLPEPAFPLLEAHFGSGIREAPAELVAGTTNLVARLWLTQGSFAIRVPRLDSGVVAVDRRAECAALDAAASAALTPEVIVCDAPSGILVTRWIEAESWTAERAHEKDAIRLVAGALTRLHAVAPPGNARSLAPLPLLRNYWQRVHARAASLAARLHTVHARVLGRAAEVQGRAAVFCHADLHHRNLIEADTLRLLDWEYAGLAEAYFDLASFAQSNDLTHEGRTWLLEAYGAAVEDSDRLALYCVLFDWICVLWLAMTGASEHAAHRPRFEALIQRVKASVE